MNRRQLVVTVMFFMLIGVPAYAYGDPSGGTLFQVLMPMMAAIWALWMILANKIRRGMASLWRKLRGMEAD